MIKVMFLMLDYPKGLVSNGTRSSVELIRNKRIIRHHNPLPIAYSGPILNQEQVHASILLFAITKKKANRSQP